jgi:hypothetical protein
MSDPVPFRDALPVAEAELDDLFEKLDIPINAKAPPCVLVLGLARQAGLVFAGLRREARGDDSGATPPILLRTLADAAILIRWIEEAPELHVDMYQAEDDRLRLAGAPAFEALHKAQGGEPGPVFPPDAEAALRAGIDATRARALAEKEPIGRAGSVLPNIEAMANATGDAEMQEAYGIIFRIASSWAHIGGRSITHHRFEERADGRHLVVEGGLPALHVRALGATLVAHLIASASRICGLDLDEAARVWQEAVATWPAEVDSE